MKRKIFVYRPGIENVPAYVNEANDVAYLDAEINEPLETLRKNGCRLVSKKTVDGKSDLITLHQRPDGTQWADCAKWTDGMELSEFLDMKSRSDSRPVSKTDLPKPSEPSPPVQVVPKTPLELCNLLSGLDSVHLGTVVGQLLVGKCVSLQRFQHALRHSVLLARESGRLRQELLNILQNKPPEEDEEEDE